MVQAKPKECPRKYHQENPMNHRHDMYESKLPCMHSIPKRLGWVTKKSRKSKSKKGKYA
jgi:hypothetical protein